MAPTRAARCASIRPLVCALACSLAFHLQILPRRAALRCNARRARASSHAHARARAHSNTRIDQRIFNTSESESLALVFSLASQCRALNGCHGARMNARICFFCYCSTKKHCETRARVSCRPSKPPASSAAGRRKTICLWRERARATVASKNVQIAGSNFTDNRAACRRFIQERKIRPQQQKARAIYRRRHRRRRLL